mmetsp:Transcript_2339/g.3277  ORF Transcript_2339/g.3277 Transcript_2339/m.3277 type:complete len:274 (+) Transcript_2339:66-887(+)
MAKERERNYRRRDSESDESSSDEEPARKKKETRSKDKRKRSRSRRSKAQQKLSSSSRGARNKRQRSRSRSRKRSESRRQRQRSKSRDDRQPPHSRNLESRSDRHQREWERTSREYPREGPLGNGHHRNRSRNRDRRREERSDERNFYNDEDIKNNQREENNSRSFVPNSGSLGMILDDTRRTNRRVDNEFWKASERMFRSLPPKEGEKIRDNYSTGMKADVQSSIDLPYSCPECSKRYKMATEVSDHLRHTHEVIKHPSLINPDKVIKTIEGN